MVFEPRCVLVTGATSEGIGRSLAFALADLSSVSQVIITGRRQNKLDEVSSMPQARGKLVGRRLDQFESPEKLSVWASDLASEYSLDLVILNAGMQLTTAWNQVDRLDFEKIQQEVYLNYTSQVALCAGFVPHLTEIAKQGGTPRLVTVTSGLACVPNFNTSNYGATKAALHSATLTMRAGLAAAGIKVIELAPPLVESQLHDEQGTTSTLSKFWMPLDEFTRAVMDGFQSELDEITVGTSKDLYATHEHGKQDKVNQIMARMTGSKP